MKKIITLLLLILIPMVSMGTLNNVFAAQTAVQTTVTQPCHIKLGWLKFNHQHEISYGTWDGTYTVFVYREHQTRDQYVARVRTSDTKVVIDNLSTSENYDAEVFITGAFLAGRQPYWQKFDALDCWTSEVKPIVNTVRTTRTTPILSTNDRLTTTEPTVLPDTGWSLGLVLVVAGALILFGTFVYLKYKNPTQQKRLDRKLVSL